MLLIADFLLAARSMKHMGTISNYIKETVLGLVSLQLKSLLYSWQGSRATIVLGICSKNNCD